MLSFSTEGFTKLQEMQQSTRAWIAAHQRYNPYVRAWFQQIEIERDRKYHINHNED